MRKTGILFLLFLILLSLSCPVWSQTDAGTDGTDDAWNQQINEALADFTKEEAQGLLALGHELVEGTGARGHMKDIYTEMEWHSVADTFPAKFDLRERGTVTPVKDQSPWGTCWTFGTMAACETSISPRKSSPTFPIKAVLFPSFCNMDNTLQGAPPGFASKIEFPCSLFPLSVKSTSNSPSATTSY